jgi:predicted acyl esterase
MGAVVLRRSAGTSILAGAKARLLVVALAVVALLGLAPAANAAITSVFTATPNPIPCAVQGNGVRLCDQTVAGNPGGTARSTVKTFDGVPIDVRVAFPPEPVSGPDGPYPLIMMFHGYAGTKLPLSSMQPLLDAGYATFSMTTRGFGQSCGNAASQSADPSGCAQGHVRLMDTRYEVRDAQEFAGLLADEGRTSYGRIGAIGGSYGGGTSMALAALKNRKMLPDGSLVAWQSPGGTPMQIAAATPEIPWTDLAYSLTPNGGTLDYVADAPYQGRTGVLKSSFENALYATGLALGFYAAAGTDPDADLRNWHQTFINGEPYDDANGNPLPAPADIRDELTTHHSSYYIDDSIPPAPLLISSGFTDDLFPADEAIRFYNRTKSEYPGAAISLFFGSFGHQRGQNKADALAARSAQELAWFNYYVRGIGPVPFQGVTAYTQTCPNAAASGGPFTAPNWAQIAPGEIRFDSPAPQTILPTAGSPSIAAPFDPITGPGACATSPSADQADTATYRMDPVPTGGFTLLGSPTVVARITSPGSDSQIAARLLDVDTSANTQTLVARGLWRPAITSTPRLQVFQLHPNGYRFADGHVVKLELLPKDSNTTPGASYGRASNNQQNVTIEDLELRLPVREAPGALGGLVGSPAAKLVPSGYQLAPGYPAPASHPRPKAASPTYVSLVVAYNECTGPAVNLTHGAPLAAPSCSPDRASDFLTAGTPDANDKAAAFVGSVKYGVQVGDPSTFVDEADVALTISLTDVRNEGDLTDYTGELEAISSVRITDRASGAGANEAATVQDVPFSVTVPCTATVGEPGASCSVSTTADAVVPGMVPEGKRSVWELGQVQVTDGGTDGLASTDGDNTLFAKQGVFVP